MSLDLPVRASQLKTKARLLAGPCFFFYFYFNELGETKTPVLADLFLARRSFVSSCLWIFECLFLGARGLTCEVAGFFEGWVDFVANPSERQRQYSVPIDSAQGSGFAPTPRRCSGQSGSRCAVALLWHG
jgi:hypothetical protein